MYTSASPACSQAIVADFSSTEATWTFLTEEGRREKWPAKQVESLGVSERQEESTSEISQVLYGNRID